MVTRAWKSSVCAASLLSVLGGCEVSIGEPLDGSLFDDLDSGLNDPSDGGTGPNGEGDAQADGSAADGSTDDPDPGTAWTIREYCEASLAPRSAWNDWFDRCCTSGSLGSAEGEFLQGLLGTTEEAIQGCTTAFEGFVASGDVVYDPAFAADCVANQRGAGIPTPPATCDGVPVAEIDVTGHDVFPLKAIAACAMAFAPQRGVEDECNTSLACPSGYRCLDSNVEGVRRCQPDAAENDPCAETIECEAGLFCVGVASSGTRTCRALGQQGSTCSETNECDNGLFCHSERGQCAVPAGVGESCVSDSDCAIDLFCDGDSCARFAANGNECSEASTCDGYCDTSGGFCESLCGS